MRAFRLALFFALGLLLGGVSVAAYAETIPATAKTAGTLSVTPLWVTSGTYKNASLSGACGAWRSAAGRVIGLCGPDSEGNGFYGTCFYDTGTAPNKICWQADAVKAGCDSGYTYNSSTQQCVNSQTVYTCPAGQNWTLSGQSCTRPDCIAPQVRNPSTGICAAPPTCPQGQTYNETTGACSTLQCPTAGTKSSGYFSGPGGGMPSSVCSVGCSISTGFCGSSGSSWWCLGGTFTGGSCFANGNSTAGSGTPAPGGEGDAAPADPVQPTSPAGKCIESGQNYGTFNGMVVCVPSTSTKTTSTKTDNTQTTPPGATAPTVTNTGTTNQTVCVEGTCTTTTTTITTTTAPDGNPQTTTTQGTATQSKAEFCAENPKAQECSGTSDQAGYCKENPNSLGCVNLGTPGDAPDIEEKEVSVSSIVPYPGASGSGSCPASVSLPRGAEFSYAPMCNFASGIRPIVIGIGWLLAGVMIFAWFRS